MDQLIELKCRNCGSQLAPEDISARLAVARCKHCNALFALPESVTSPQPIARPEVELPKRFTIERANQTLAISWRWFSPAVLGLLFFAVFWNGFLIVWHTIALSQGAWFMSVFGLLHTGVGVFLAYWVVAKLMNRTTVYVSKDWIQVRLGPIPWSGKQDLKREGIVQLFCKEKVQRGKNGTSQTYQVEVVLEGNLRKTLVKGLESADQAIFVEQQIEKYLGLADVPVDGEYGR
ncbi:hypothetical protein [Haloferula sp. A504]|uniref:hypothetical protein n=1 Tax=Haloferula sp. A504 TaxID=3373601 RepID=UPI0031C0618B|nr:hypothetical protein [Verrucomicrobiaceae bacterium E54]